MPQLSRISTTILALAAIGVAASTTSTADTASRPEASLELRYAEAQLRLAELGLKRVERMNRQVPNAVSISVVAQYKRDVAATTRRLEAVRAQRADAQFQFWLDHVEAASQSAENEWQRARAANRRASGAVDPIDVQRTRLRADLFQLLAKQGERLADKPLVEKLAWQNEVLLNQVQRLNEEVLRNQRVGGYYYTPLDWR